MQKTYFYLVLALISLTISCKKENTTEETEKKK